MRAVIKGTRVTSAAGHTMGKDESKESKGSVPSQEMRTRKKGMKGMKKGK